MEDTTTEVKQTQEEALRAVHSAKDECTAILEKYGVSIIPIFHIEGTTLKTFYRYEKIIK